MECGRPRGGVDPQRVPHLDRVMYEGKTFPCLVTLGDSDLCSDFLEVWKVCVASPVQDGSWWEGCKDRFRALFSFSSLGSGEVVPDPGPLEEGNLLERHCGGVARYV